jgi:hypothetical protein
MNSIPFIDYFWCSGPWFSERIDAVENGYYHIFTIEPNNCYRCLSDPQCFYSQDEVKVSKISLNGLVLHIIETKDGHYKGTVVEYENRRQY